jgi:glycosyltransferase involved in cell wall biosynthesis
MTDKQQKLEEIFRSSELIMCSFVPVGLEDYVEYLKNHFTNFTYLKWKFPHGKGNIKSEKTSFKKGKLLNNTQLFSFPTLNNKPLYFLLLPLDYLNYIFQALYRLWPRNSGKNRIFIGINYYCTLCGIILKKIGRVDFVIYRVMDFFPIPKSGPYRILNRIFHLIDKYCLNNSDSIWFTTEGHIEGREKYGYFDRNKYNYHIIPLGINQSKVFMLPLKERSKFSLVYCGVISKYHQVDLILKSIKKIKNKFPKVILNIIGTGPDEEYFKGLSRRLKIDTNVKFHGYIKEGEDFNYLMANNSLGFALYKDEEDFMKYTEPAKAKYYLSFGVPVIISDVPKIAKEFQTKEVGFIVENNVDSISKIIAEYIFKEDIQKKYISNIKKYIKEVNIDKLLDNAFSNIHIN